jgi:ribosomal protein S12 methylthiotransferase
MKIGLVSLGCPKNLVDSEVMLGLSQEAGHEPTSNASEADVLIVNTCAFIDAARQESVETILEMARQKKTGACRRLIVTGCLAERYRDQLRAEIPEIDLVLGTGEVPDIVGAIEGPAVGRQPLTFLRTRPAPDASARRASRPRPGARPAPSYLYDAETPRLLATPRHYAYVKVAEGCNYACAFCIIPTLRGPYRSRPSESVVSEARRLAAGGAKELLLVSQDTTFYGRDRQERGALARLLRALNDVDGLEWIRLLYLYPTTIDDDVLSAVAECGKVCKYIDLPLQHASNRVLERMKRPGTRRTYDRLLDRIRRRVPGVVLRTTFIVGFPGETTADVDELTAFAAGHAFDHLGVFTYSHEEGTSAHGLDDDVPARAKLARRNRVMRLQRRLVRERHRRRIGERATVMVDGPADDRGLVLKGRLSSQAPGIDSIVYLTGCDPSQYRPGQLLAVEIVGAHDYDIVARPVL